MCDECLQNPCANTCPNNPHFYDNPVMKTCPICEREYDEEDMMWSVCDSCLFAAETYENALAWGNEEKKEIEINGFLAYAFTSDQIEEVLREKLDEYGNITIDRARKSYAEEYCYDDKSAFADWLVEQKNNH